VFPIRYIAVLGF